MIVKAWTSEFSNFSIVVCTLFDYSGSCFYKVGMVCGLYLWGSMKLYLWDGLWVVFVFDTPVDSQSLFPDWFLGVDASQNSSKVAFVFWSLLSPFLFSSLIVQIGYLVPESSFLSSLSKQLSKVCESIKLLSSRILGFSHTIFPFVCLFFGSADAVLDALLVGFGR